jgi:tubulin polyglutamylase TTLL6/13
MLTTAG